ncbi:unnamed protein product [Kuraishia capsulata CBS 1993]|uniref:Phosducin domain-containing protein n=1 Tax=Kuraishia capsulata CBS 1993 TaxID=1382522 RepID=W6MPH1_9ASCO|nr:uncharacterized protein KUCA_T00004583001 [Kuraishia capsulata CBS 1993]CDK28599.1 unnamed protein product [Kuraishia capsulata CBS 1993]
MDPKIEMQVDPNEDTEWNDILRAHGIIPQKEPDPTEELEELLQEAVQKQHENRLEGKDLDELEALEDEEDEDFLEEYKQKRLAEIAELTKKSKFGSVYPITKPEYKKEITDASNESFIFLHMTLSSNQQSRLLSAIMQRIAPKFAEIKFCEIPANRAVENYPDANCPTILIYYKGDLVQQYITLTQLGGSGATIKDIEKALVGAQAVKDDDKRLEINQQDEDLAESRMLRFAKKSIRSSAKDDEDDDFFD